MFFNNLLVLAFRISDLDLKNKRLNHEKGMKIIYND
jgi:hypothetical protein